MGRCTNITRKKCPSGRFTNGTAVQTRRAVFYSPQGFVRVPGPFVIFGQSQVVLVAQQEQILGYDHCRRRRRAAKIAGRLSSRDRNIRSVAGGRTIYGASSVAVPRRFIGDDGNAKTIAVVYFLKIFFIPISARTVASNRRTLSPQPRVSCGVCVGPGGDSKRAIGDVRAVVVAAGDKKKTIR